VNFNLANNGPVAVKIDGTEYLLPRFKRRDWIAWAASVDAERTAQATADMKPDERFRYLSIYSVLPVTTDELSRRVFTPAGTERILRTCMTSGKVPAELIEKVLDEGASQDLNVLALTLASIIDPEKIQAEADKDEQGGEVDPLPSAASA
jgi:hypothetical protein